MNYCKRRGAVVYNIHGNEYQSGVPDLLVGYKGWFISLELKAPNGQLSKLQRYRLRMTQRAGCIAEEIYSLERVKEIFACIDAGEEWINGDYSNPKGGKG
ncbi:MAG: VRR-NUC domain-containing protein [Candidatus Izemoplasmatales bacterium]